MGTKRRPYGYWKNLENRVIETRKLVEATGKNPKELTQKDFVEHGLCGLLTGFYNASPYLALKEAGYAIKPWQMKNGVPRNYWKDSVENRIKAIKWLIDKTGKGPKDITLNDFRKNGLGGLLSGQYGGSPYHALKEAGLVDFEPWEMKSGAPQGYWKENVENRVRATKWLVKKTGKDPKDITLNDFQKNGLSGLLGEFYNDSSYFALKEAGLVDFETWEMKGNAPQGYWKENVENRVRATKWLVKKTGKDPEKVCRKDFEENGLGGLLSGSYNRSRYLALKEAGYDIKAKHNKPVNAAELLKRYIQK